jgi:hypothetical protein
MKIIRFKVRTLYKKYYSRIGNIFDRKRKPVLHTAEWLLVLLAFFVIGLAVMYDGCVKMFFEEKKQISSESREALIQTSEEQEMFMGKTLLESIDTTSWDTYQNKWYGFEVGHPDSWKNNTQYKTATEKSAVYETIYKFRKDNEENSIFVGYDVKIYPVKKVKNIESTNDIHKKDIAPEDEIECSFLSEEIQPDGGDLVFQKISISDNNPCYKPAYFYSVAKGDYIYNIVPAVGESGERFSEPEKETDKIFPEYKEAVKTISFIPVVRPKPKTDPRIGVKKPVSAKIVNGKLVCAKKNDKPHKSDKNKPRHLDLECCLDPDETPNPWCTY